jgi:alanine dehydrogenase
LPRKGNGQTEIEPRVHLEPKAANGHFNVLRGALRGADRRSRRQGRRRLRRQLQDRPALGMGADSCSTRFTACRPRSSTAAVITDMRTGAVTAIGAKYLARKGSKVLGHIGARGTAYWNVRLLDSSLRFRRDPRPFAPARKPRRFCGANSPPISASASS